LYNALDHIRNRYGDRAIIRAIGLEARTIGGHNPFSGEPPALLANRRS
jgi:DNA polymerase-4